MFSDWNAPLSAGGCWAEMALTFDRQRSTRLLIIPPLFDEHNKLRHQLVETMRRLDENGIDTILPDLPGCNESTAPLAQERLGGWRHAVELAIAQFRITHQLTVRSGALLSSGNVHAFTYAPQSGAQLLRSMVRARSIAAREAGREEKPQEILERGRKEGIELAGWQLGARMVRELETAEAPDPMRSRIIEQSEIGGSPLWLRAEAACDPEQATRLASLLAAEIGSAE